MKETFFIAGQLWLATAMILVAMDNWTGAVISFLLSIFMNYLKGKS